MLQTRDGSMEPPPGSPLHREPTMASLNALFGEVEARRIWRDVCARADVDANSPALDFDAMQSIAEILIARGGNLSLVGSSLSIRVHTYRMLSSAQRLEAFLEGGTKG